MKVIAFSLWNFTEYYLKGAIANIHLASAYYPDWQCRIYCANDIPPRVKILLSRAGYTIILKEKNQLWDGLFWRFEPIFDPSVEITIIRDITSRLNPREAAAVNAWITSGKRLHTMRDHYQQSVPIHGGRWGCRHWPEFKPIYCSWPHRSVKNSDQDFLRHKIWPLVKDTDVIAHDRYPNPTKLVTPHGTFIYDPVRLYGHHFILPFPPHEELDPALHGTYVGCRID